MTGYSFLKTVRTLSVSVLGTVGIAAGSGSAIAQNVIVPDGTTDSVVSPFSNGSPDDVISGGFIDGSNLLHSFQEFNVAEERGAYFFTNPTNIENIFSRVTGSNASEIYGRLGTFGNSTPNLWLINPNGILFGSNAVLDVDGSFVASTANAVLIDGTIPFAASSVSENPGILQIDDSALFFNELSNARIENRSQVNLGASNISLHGLQDFEGLAVPNGESLIFASPEILINGGGLNALNGEIQLFSQNRVDFINSATAQADHILVATNQLSVEDGSQILAQFLDPRILSNVVIKDSEDSQSFEVSNIQDLQSLPTLEGGNISIFAREFVEVTGTDDSGQTASRIGTGAIGLLSNGGNVSIQTDRLGVREGGQITSNYISLSERNEGGGEIDIDAESIEIVGRNSAEKRRQSGFFVGNGYRFRLSTNGAVDLDSDSVNILDGAQVSLRLRPISISDDFQPFPGNITVRSNEATVSGTSSNGVASALSTNSIFSTALTNDTINIESEKLTIAEGGQINSFFTTIDADEVFLEDDAVVNSAVPVFSRRIPVVRLTSNAISIEDDAEIRGEIEVDSVRLQLRENASINGEVGISSEIDSGNGIQPDIDLEDILSFTPGVVGNININSDEVSMQDNASIRGDSITIESDEVLAQDNTSIFGDNITIGSGVITIKEQSQVLANQLDEGARSGGIFISTGRLDVLDSGRVSASAEGFNNSGGTVEIVAVDSVNVIADPISNAPAAILATADSPGRGGNISVESGSITILNGAQLSASLNGGGTGGSIRILARDSVTVEGTSDDGSPSQISAESNLNGGEFGILRSIRANSQSIQDVSTVLNGRMFIFSQATPSSIRSLGSDDIGGTNTITLTGDVVPIETGNAISQTGTGEDSTNIVNLNNPGVPTEKTSIFSQSAGTAQQVFLLNSSVPDDGLLIVGQSFGTNFDEAVAGGEVINSDAVVESLSNSFLTTLESILKLGINEEQADNEQLVNIIEGVDDVRQAFLNGAGEFYVVASAGDEFKIKDEIYTDTTFSQTESDDLFLIFAIRDGGDISIETGDLIVRDGASVSTALLGSAEGGSSASQLNIAADSILLENDATITATSETGAGGNVVIRTSDMALRNNSFLTAAATENAIGGNITVDARGFFTASNSNISSSSESRSGGNINISASSIRLEGDSDIQTDVASGDGNGGNIELSANSIIAFDDSDILANAQTGSGGRINLRTAGFFGNGFTSASLTADPSTLDGNDRVDVNATGGVDGEVVVPDVSFLENGLANLPDNLIVPDQLLANSCIARSTDGRGTLVETGRDGVYISPESVSAPSFSTGTVQSTALRTTDGTIEEPHEIYRLADGRLFMGKPCS